MLRLYSNGCSTFNAFNRSNVIRQRWAKLRLAGINFVARLALNRNITKKKKNVFYKYQRWSRGHKARGQGHKKNLRPRPRTAFPRTDTLEAKDRNARGQGQGPSASALQKKKKKVFTKIFQAISTKKRFPKIFSSSPQNFNNSKNSAVLEPRTGQFSRT